MVRSEVIGPADSIFLASCCALYGLATQNVVHECEQHGGQSGHSVIKHWLCDENGQASVRTSWSATQTFLMRQTDARLYRLRSCLIPKARDTSHCPPHTQSCTSPHTKPCTGLAPWLRGMGGETKGSDVCVCVYVCVCVWMLDAGAIRMGSNAF